MSDPVFREKGKWYYWTETWADRNGPFDSEGLARESLKRYGEWLSTGDRPEQPYTTGLEDPGHAEIEDLKKRLSEAEHDRDLAMSLDYNNSQRIDEYKGQLEQLRAELTGHDPCPSRVLLTQAEREIERLRAELHRGSEMRLLLRQEIKGLRAALRRVLESFTEPEDDNDIIHQARAALGQERSEK